MLVSRIFMVGVVMVFVTISAATAMAGCRGHRRRANPPTTIRPAMIASLALVETIRARKVVVVVNVGTAVVTARAPSVAGNPTGAAVTGIRDNPAASAAAGTVTPRWANRPRSFS